MVPLAVGIATLICNPYLLAICTFTTGPCASRAAGPVDGVYSSASQSYTFNLRCASCKSFGCPAKMKAVDFAPTGRIDVYYAEGLPHSHSGPFLLKRGLPPQLKLDVEMKLGSEPRIRLSALSKHVFEDLRWPLTFKGALGNYLTNHRARAGAMSLGVSSFGTVYALIHDRAHINVVLASPDATFDTTGVIGFELDGTDPADPRVLILFTSVKMAMFAFESTIDGYSDGKLLADYTYKVLKELLKMLVFSTVDIQQHGKPCAFGPASHEDATMVSLATRLLKDFIDILVKGIHTRALPQQWSAELKESLYDTYGAKVDAAFARGVREYAPGATGSDLAPALPNGMHFELPSVHTHFDCWVHTWRAVMNNKGKLQDSTQDNIDDIYTDLTMLASLPSDFSFVLGRGTRSGVYSDEDEDEVEQWVRKTPISGMSAGYGPAINFFIQKWTKAGEGEFVEYLKKYHLWHTWSRAWGNPGDPNSTNTHERFNLLLKGHTFFDTVEGVGTIVQQAPVIGARLSMHFEPMAIAPAIKAQTWQKAQKLVEQGYYNLAFFLNKAEGIIGIPSTELIKKIPPELTTVNEQLGHLTTWCKEFKKMYNQKERFDYGDTKRWDFDQLMDMLYSFWIITPINDTHPRREVLAEIGIKYTCTCPAFLHYHVCKHCLAYSLHKKEITVPKRFSLQTAGKRKAPAGASLSKRSKALIVDN